MYWTSFGQADQPCVVMLHGFLGRGRDWQVIAEPLSENYYCLCPDLPGHGQSGELRLDSTQAFSAFSTLLSAELTSQGIRTYQLLGYSLGGRLAMYHACQRPTGLQALLLESAHSGLSSAVLRHQRQVHDQAWAQRWQQQNVQQSLSQWYQQSVFASLTTDQRQQLHHLRRNQDQAGLAAMLQATSLGLQPDLLPDLAQLTLPIHYMCGVEDGKFSALAQHLAQHISGFNWKQQANAGHNIHLEQPTAFVEWLRQSLTR